MKAENRFQKLLKKFRGSFVELYLIRHGQTVWNEMGKLQGRADIELNENGRRVAGELGLKLDNVDFDVIYSSPLIRAYETACLIRGHRNIRIIRDERLVEINFGAGEGDSWAAWNKPESPFNAFFTDTASYIPPEGGESLEEIMARTKDFVQTELEPACSKLKRVMVVAHGALNSALMCYLENNGKDHFWGKGLQKNCQASVFEYDGSSWSRKEN